MGCHGRHPAISSIDRLVHGVGLSLLLLVPGAAAAQVIPTSGLPLGDRAPFLALSGPSDAMGGVGIALRDAWTEPLRNPAWGTRLPGSILFSGFSRDRQQGSFAGGNAYPSGGLLRLGGWSVGFIVGGERLTPAWRLLPYRGPDRTGRALEIPRPPVPWNVHVGIQTAHPIGGSRWSVGLAVRGDRIRHVPGSEHLYQQEMYSRTSGGRDEIRLGLLGMLGSGRNLDIVAFRNRSRTDVEAVQPWWYPWESGAPWPGEDWQSRLDPEQDVIGTAWNPTWPVSTWTVHHVHESLLHGLEIRGLGPAGQEGWQRGWSITANWLSAPRITASPEGVWPPVPAKDPWLVRSFRFGYGWIRRGIRETFAFDILHDQVLGYTWWVPSRADEVYLESPLAVGATLRSQRVRFGDWTFRLGAERAFSELRLQVGYALRLVGYRVRKMVRSYREDGSIRNSSFYPVDQAWTEQSLTWGAALPFPGGQIRYAASLRLGTGRPVHTWPNMLPNTTMNAALLTDAGVLYAEEEPMRAREVRVVTHQVSLIIPIGK